LAGFFSAISLIPLVASVARHRLGIKRIGMSLTLEMADSSA
jgi:hypothetical protein